MGNALGSATAPARARDVAIRTRALAPATVVVLALVSAVFIAGLAAYHWLVYVPRPDQPHALTILDRLFEIGVACALVLDGALLGLRLLRRLPLRALFGPLELAGIATGLGLGLASLGVLALGALHLYYPATFAVLLLGVPLLLRQDLRHLAHRMRSRVAAYERDEREHPSARVDVLPRLALAAIALCALAFTFLLDMSAPTTWTGYDTYQYHWAVPALLLRAHGWQAFPGWAHANLPFNSEMLNLVALSLRAPEAASLVQDSFTLLSALLIFAFVRRHFDATSAWLAVVAFVTVPLLVMYSAQSYVEPALLFYGIATLTVLARWVERSAARHAVDGSLLALAGALFGLALGVKYMALEYLPGALLIIAIGVIWSAAARRTRGWWKLGLIDALRAVAVFGGSVIVAVGPWLVKDWLLLSNPVYPALASLFGAPAWDAARTQTLQATFLHFGQQSGAIARLHLYALDLFIHPESYGEGSAFPMGLAATTAVLALPYFVLAVGRGWARMRDMDRGKTLVVAAWTAAILLAFAAWTFSGALVERYALPAVALAAVLGATLVGALAARLPQRLRAVTVVLPLLMAAALVFQNAGLYYTNYVDQSPFPLLRARMSEQTFQRAHLSQGVSADFWQAADYINQVLPHDGKLLMLGRGTGYFFTNRDYVADSGGDWVPYIVSAGKTSAGMASVLRAQGFSYVVYDGDLMTWLTGVYDNRVLAGYLPDYLRFQASQLRLIAKWGNVSLYRVPGPGAAAVAPPPPVMGGASEGAHAAIVATITSVRSRPRALAAPDALGTMHWPERPGAVS